MFQIEPLPESSKVRTEATTLIQDYDKSYSMTNCPKNTFGKYILQSHPANCSLYFICINGQQRLESCANGLNFDPSLGQCNFPHKLECQ